MELNNLKEIGLSEGEIKVYLAILKIGFSSINNIHEKTGIERRNIYDILNKLIEKGMVSYSLEKGRKTYQAANPNKLLEIIKNKEKKLKELEKSIPELNETYINYKPKISGEVYRGYEGIKAVWEDSLNYKDIYWIGSGRYIPKKLPNFFKSYNNRRIKLKVAWHNLARIELKKEIKKPFQLEYIKFLPKEFSGNPTVTGIYGDKVVNFLFGKEVFAFVIESKELAENYKKYHKYLWDKIAKN